jgi:hypothetical protein
MNFDTLSPVFSIFAGRPAVELGLLLLLAWIAGFVTARMMYAPRVAARSRLLRREMAKSRRSLSVRLAETRTVEQERDRARREVKALRRSA